LGFVNVDTTDAQKEYSRRNFAYPFIPVNPVAFCSVPFGLIHFYLISYYSMSFHSEFVHTFGELNQTSIFHFIPLDPVLFHFIHLIHFVFILL